MNKEKEPKMEQAKAVEKETKQSASETSRENAEPQLQNEEIQNGEEVKAEEEALEEKAPEDELTLLRKELEEKSKESDSYQDRWKRSMAEFDNFRKRTVKEKEAERNLGAISVLNNVLPLIDNLERAMASIPEEEKENAIAKGVNMTYQQFMEGLKKMGVEEIAALGEQFDPNLHNAVMHIEDEKIDENTVCEVFQKGYTYKGQVLRYSMVKVAN